MTDKRVAFVSLMIAFLPLTAFIRVPGISLGLGMVELIVLTPWLFLINGKRLFPKTLKKFSLLILFCLYSMARSVGNTTNMLGFALVMIWVIGTNEKWINEHYMFKAMKAVSTTASAIVILQTICYYILGFHLVSNLPILLKIESREQYSLLISSGVDKFGMYRPSAFFLEPAHFAQYGIVTLLWCLLRDKEKHHMIFAMIISTGIALTTSGMGISMVIGAWFIYILWGMNLNNKRNIAKASILIILGIVLIICLLQISIFKNSINRITGNNGGYNAIIGRLIWWDYYFKPLSVSQLVLGLGYAMDTSNYMTGFMKMLYCTGYVGVTIFYLMLLQHTNKATKFSITLTLFYGVLVIFAGITTVINLIFFLSIIFIDEKNEISMKREN